MNIISRRSTAAGFFAMAYAGFAAVCYRLYLRQAIHYPGKLGVYDSDLPAHIHEGRSGTGYSFMEKSFGFLMNTMKTNEKAVALWLALLTVATVWVTFRVMKKLFPAGNGAVLHLMAFVSMFWMPIYLPQLNPYRYLGLQSGTVWHNSTYLGMRLAGMLLLLFYFEYQETYRHRFSAGQFIWFTVLLIFVNLMKPNFILCFAPAMAVMLLTDCIAERGKKLKRQILFGIPVLISLAVVVYETMVLFSGENGGSSIVFDFGFSIMMRAKRPVIALLQSGAFPAAVLLGNLSSLKKDRRFRVSWLTWLFALAEYLCLCEDGPRKTHGNMSWGYCFALFLVFAVSMIWLYRNLMEFYAGYQAVVRGISGKEDSNAGRKHSITVLDEIKGIAEYIRKSSRQVKVQTAWLIFVLILFVLHLYFGAEFTWIIFNGGSYAG